MLQSLRRDLDNSIVSSSHALSPWHFRSGKVVTSLQGPSGNCLQPCLCPQDGQKKRPESSGCPHFLQTTCTPDWAATDPTWEDGEGVGAGSGTKTPIIAVITPATNIIPPRTKET